MYKRMLILHQRLFMRKSTEPVFTVCRPYPRIVHATKRQVRMQEVHDCKVNPYSAGTRPFDNISGKSFVLVEYVKRQRLGVIVYFIDNRINIIKLNNR